MISSEPFFAIVIQETRKIGIEDNRRMIEKFRLSKRAYTEYHRKKEDYYRKNPSVAACIVEPGNRLYENYNIFWKKVKLVS